MVRAASGGVLLALCGLLAGCAGRDPETPMVMIDCATDGARDFTRSCKVEQVAEGGGIFWSSTIFRAVFAVCSKSMTGAG
jgi:hypothetical protein